MKTLILDNQEHDLQPAALVGKNHHLGSGQTQQHWCASRKNRKFTGRSPKDRFIVKIVLRKTL